MKKLTTFILALTLIVLMVTGLHSTAQSQSGLWVTVYYPTWMFRSGSSSIWYAVPPWNMKFTGVTHVIQFGNVNVTTTPPYFTPITTDSLEWAYGTQSNGEATRTYYRDSLVTIAHRQGAKVLICIQQAQSGSALNSITLDSATTDAFAAAVAGYVQRHNYDGVDVNWETSIGTKTQTSLLFRRLRANLGSSAVITISPLSGGWGNYDAATCNAYVNQINPQEYDISDAWNGCISANGNWPLNALHQGTTSGCSGTNQQGYDTRGPLQWASKGFQPSILGIGIASFGRMYVGSKVIGGAHPISRQDVCSYYTGNQLLTSGGGVLVQDTARNAEYIVGTAPSNFSYRNCTVSAGQDYFFTYQTPGVIPGQVNWVKQNGFGGLMVYDFQGDCDKAGGYGQTNPIIYAIVAAVGNGPALPDTIKPVVGLTSPASGSTVSGTVTVSATATDNVGVASVDFLVDGAVVSSDASGPYSYAWNTSGLSGNHTLTARARDFAGNTAVTPGATVTISVALPPPVPTNQSPANFSVITPSSGVQFTWTSSAGATSYRFQLSTDSTFASTAANLNVATNSVIVSALITPAKYFWHVMASGSGGSSAYSVMTSFTTSTGATTPPPAPLLVSPVMNSTSQPTDSTFVWNKAPGASLYRIQVAADSLFTTNVVDDSTLIDTLRRISGLNSLASYYWHVDARNPVGWGPWSSVRQFTTRDDVAPTVAITFPTPSTTLSDSVTVTATAADNDAIHGVQFYVDGMLLGPEDTTAPYEIRWTTLAVANGKHSLTAVAKDKYANSGTSPADSVTVYNASAVSDLWVYQDSLVPTWFSAAWSGTYDFASTEQSYSQPYSVKCATAAFGGLRIRSSRWGTIVNIDPSLYARVEFHLYSPSPSLKLAFYLENESHGTFPVLKYKNFPANQWVTVSVPMSTLNPGNLPVQFVTIQSNCPSARTFYIDDIRFVAARPGGLTPALGFEPEIDEEVPSQVDLASNFPNPFNPTTTIAFEMPEDSYVSLKVYDILGRQVAVLFDQQLAAGKYQSTWNPGDLAGGVYFYKLDATGLETSAHTSRVRKMLFVK